MTRRPPFTPTHELTLKDSRRRLGNGRPAPLAIPVMLVSGIAWTAEEWRRPDRGADWTFDGLTWRYQGQPSPPALPSSYDKLYPRQLTMGRPAARVAGQPTVRPISFRVTEAERARIVEAAKLDDKGPTVFCRDAAVAAAEARLARRKR